MPKEYPPNFLRFWEAYPRKTAKATAARAWEKQKIESDAFLPEAVIGNVEARTRAGWWPDDKTKIPMPSSFINARRWEDEDWREERKSEVRNGHRRYEPSYAPPDRDEGPKLDDWQRMQNKLLLRYLMLGPLPEDDLAKAVHIKNDTLTEFRPYLEEQIDAAPAEEKRDTRLQMMSTLVETTLHRLDHDLGLKRKHLIIE